MSRSAIEDHDAVVIGAGVAGCSAAIALALQGRRVAIVEKAEFPRRKVCGEFLSATSVPVLDALGVGAAWRRDAGPEVRRVSVFSGERIVEAPMPRAGHTAHGRALGRDVLDTMMLARAADLGVRVLQPFKARAFTRTEGMTPNGLTDVTVEGAGEVVTLRAPLMIAAHGSWERGTLSTNLPKQNRPDDMMGFKAYFRGARLAADTMPLLAFPGGYGGIVWADGGRLSISCCTRRDRLDALRAGGRTASEAMHAHLLASMAGVRQTLATAELDGVWLATGPIRPGIRPRYADDIFRIGNVAGESHPIIAEGQSMAIQSAWLLASALDGIDIRDPAARAAAGRVYGKAWHRQFAGRIRAAAAFSYLAMRPGFTNVAGAVIGRMPRLIEVGARLSGKTRAIQGLDMP